MPKPFVVVIVLNYNSASDSLACVDALRKQRYTHWRLLVLDNASADSSARQLTAALAKEEFLPLPRNLGYAGGNNVGIRRAAEWGADYVLILNPDTRVPPGGLDAWIDRIEANPHIGALNPLNLNEAGDALDEKFRMGLFVHHGREAPSLDDPTLPDQRWWCGTLFGASLLLRVAALKQAGLFDPIYFAYGEEEDLCKRIRLAGFELELVGAEPVRHLRSNERGRPRWRILFLRLRSKYLLMLKSHDRPLRENAGIAAKTFASDWRQRRQLPHPFNSGHFLAVGLWLVISLPRIVRHRRRERQPGAYW